MIRERNVARGALLHVSALGADNRSRITALIEKNKSLITVFKAIIYLFFQRGGKRRIVAAADFLSHIHHVHHGQRLFIYSVGKLYEIILAFLCF